MAANIENVQAQNCPQYTHILYILYNNSTLLHYVVKDE